MQINYWDADPRFWANFAHALKPFGWTDEGHRGTLVHKDGARVHLTLRREYIETPFGTPSHNAARTKVRDWDTGNPNLTATAHAWAKGPGQVRIDSKAEAMAQHVAAEARKQETQDAAASLRDFMIAANVPSPYAGKGYYPPAYVMAYDRIDGYRVRVTVYQGGTDPSLSIQVPYLPPSDIPTAIAELEAVNAWLSIQRAKAA